MNKLASIVTFTAALSVAATAFAGGGRKCHFHGNAPIKEAVLVGCASDYKDGLVSNGKIEASWKSAKLDQAETVEGKK